MPFQSAFHQLFSQDATIAAVAFGLVVLVLLVPCCWRDGWFRARRRSAVHPDDRRAGWRGEARETWEGTVAHASDLVLLSEELDPASGELLGNMPPALSHLALLMAARQLSDESRDDNPDD